MSDEQGKKEVAVTEHLNTDERKAYEWKSKWCDDSSKKIRVDAIYIAIVFIFTIILIISIWKGTLFQIIASDCSHCDISEFNKFAYMFVGGLFGGTIYGIKYLYKVVARGWWHLDRRLWRIFSPWLSGGVALAFGTLFDSGIVGLSINTDTASGYFAIGFISGYFADRAVAKMQEVADTIFGFAGK